MPPRNRTTPATTASEPTFAVETADASLLKVTRESKPNPMLSAVERSLSEGVALRVAVTDAVQAADVENMLRRAAKVIGCGLSQKNIGTHIVFKARRELRERNYTTAQIREWARENGATDEMLFPRVSKEVRAKFREAHGYRTKDASKK